MSRILDNTAITDLAQLPYKKGTVKFLQDSHKIDLANVVSSLLNIDGANTTAYVLYGCINTGTYPAYNISDGVIYYGGEIYNVAASSFTATGSNVAVLKLVVTQYTTDADPVTFTDSVARNVHNIRTLNFQAGASGSGISDYTGLSIPSFSTVSETARAKAAEATLQTNIDTINAPWASQNNIADVTVTGGSGTAVTFSTIRYKANGKTLHMVARFAVSNTTAPTAFTLAIPNGYTSNVPFEIGVHVDVFDSVTGQVLANAATTNGSGVIGISLGSGVSLTNTQPTEVRIMATFEIA